MSEDTEIGDNAAAVLKGIIDEIYDLKVEEKAAKKTRKGLVTDLKEENLSAAVLVGLMTQDPAKVSEKVQQLKVAGALLGKPVYTEAFSDEDAAALVEELGEEVQTYALEKTKEIMATDEDIRKISDDIKAQLKEAKSTGFDGKTIMTVVDFRLDPEKQKKYQERSLLLDKYLEVVG